MFVPSSSVVSGEGGDRVWVVDSENRAQTLSVTAGAARDGRTEILDGLDETARLIVDPANLTAGQLVKVVEN
jgi:hypothetical protein